MVRQEGETSRQTVAVSFLYVYNNCIDAGFEKLS